MHETSLMEQIIIIAEDQLKDYKVKKVNEVVVAVGKLANLIPGALEFAYESLSKKTILNGAKLVMESVPIEARCRDCGGIYNAESVPLTCPVCTSHDADIIAGTDVYLMSIDFDELEECENEN